MSYARSWESSFWIVIIKGDRAPISKSLWIEAGSRRGKMKWLGKERKEDEIRGGKAALCPFWQIKESEDLAGSWPPWKLPKALNIPVHSWRQNLIQPWQLLPSTSGPHLWSLTLSEIQEGEHLFSWVNTAVLHGVNTTHLCLWSQEKSRAWIRETENK